MLKPTRIAITPTTQELVQHWADRYRTDLRQFSNTHDPLILEQYVMAAYPENRRQTVDRIQRSLHLYCELGAVNTVALFAIAPNVVNLTEARRLAKFVQQVYQEVLSTYAHQASSLTLSAPLPVEEMSEIMELLLLQLQEQHKIAKDPRTIGFLTTQFHLTTQVIMRTCTPYERVWLRPYFQFIEEQVGIPWQRTCAAAEAHDTESPVFQVVATLLPLCQTISQQVYRQAVAQYPEHRSRRGALKSPKLAPSSLRDISMFQGYFCLCLLEGNMEAIAAELLPLCQLVFPSLEIQWDLVETGMQLLINAMNAVLTEDQQDLIRSFTAVLQALFTRPSGATGNDLDLEDLEEADDLADLAELAESMAFVENMAAV